MKTEKLNPSRAGVVDEPVATLARLASIVPNSSAFGGWGPRMASSVRNVIRGLN